MEEALIIPQAIFQRMVAHLRAVYPQEGCGLLAGVSTTVSASYPIDNLLHSPIAYEMDPRQQIETMLAIESAGLEMVAIYHSHPRGPGAPSETDVAYAYYPDTRQVIVSLARPEQPDANVYWIADGMVRPVALQIV